MSLRALAFAVVGLSLLAPSSALADDGGADAATDASVTDAAPSDASADASKDGASDGSTDAAADAPVYTSDAGPETFRPDSGSEVDAGSPATPTDDGGCNAAGDAAAAGWPLVLGLAALLRRKRRGH